MLECHDANTTLSTLELTRGFHEHQQNQSEPWSEETN